MTTDSPLLHEAELIDQHLRLIRCALRHAFDADKNRSQLTAPQIQVMALLVEAQRGDQPDLSIRDLSQRMGLAQSTISSLVERLESKKLVTRRPDPDDRRFTRIVLTENVKTYVSQAILDRRLAPLIAALQRATPQERQSILDSITLLSRLLENPAP